jgi:hypothetical protein
MKIDMTLLSSTHMTGQLASTLQGQEVNVGVVFNEDAPSLDVIIPYIQAALLLNSAGLWPAEAFSRDFDLKGFFSADFSLDGLHQEGDAIVGTLNLVAKAGPISAKFSEKLRVPTYVPNPYVVTLGTITIGIPVPVIVTVYYDLVNRTLKVELSLAGWPVISKTFHW